MQNEIVLIGPVGIDKTTVSIFDFGGGGVTGEFPDEKEAIK